MKQTPAALWGVLAAGALILHFWPMAYWSRGALLFFRGAGAFCAQMFFLKKLPGRAAAALPLLMSLLLLWRMGFSWDYGIPLPACAGAILLHLLLKR